MKGTYVLIIENSKDMEAKIGKIGNIEFKKGFYAYVGSALSGLEQRIERHLRAVGKNKKLHWHIDYFLACHTVGVKEVVFAETDERKECEIASKMNRDRELDLIKNFGCTDCSCRSHLFLSTSLARLKEHIYKSFYESGLEHLLATKINPV